MLLNLMKVLNEPDSSLTVNDTIDLSSLVVEEGIESFPSGAKVSIVLKNIMDCITLSLKCEFEYVSECARCLELVTQNLSFDFESIVKVDENAEVILDADAVVIDSSNQLDVDELVIGLVLMNLPMRVLCKDDCAGLCPKCGKNLNEGECDCEKKEVDPRLLKLKELLDDNKLS